MSLTPQSTIGSFEIIDRLGAGAMGEVYRARDNKLGRDVAIKILPDSLAGDPRRRARFEREARLLASLTHPNIAALYELGLAGKTNFLVMELVNGTTLAERLKNGPLTLDVALPLFTQIADALETAHEKGVIHRDLKPSNVMVTDDGNAKLLDFGLAKALDATQSLPGSSGEAATCDLEHEDLTGERRILGTPAYMSPEQASGEQADKRADIWSFGCCLYEAIAGQRPFQGDSATQLLARVLEKDPDWDALPDTTPSRIRILVWRCLQKDPKRRLRDIGEARFELSDSAADSTAKVFTEKLSGSSRRPRNSVAPIPLLLGILVGIVVTLIGIALYSSRAGQSSSGGLTQRSDFRIEEPQVIRSTFDITGDQAKALSSVHYLGMPIQSLTLSPDGSRLAYVADTGEETQIFVRDLNKFEGRPLPGTTGGYLPFFAPDGESLAFFTDSQLMIVAVDGASPQSVCETRNVLGGCWDTDGTIYIVEQEGVRISSIPSDRSDAKEVIYELEWPVTFPSLLPDGKGLLVTGRFHEGNELSYDSMRLLHLPTREIVDTGDSRDVTEPMDINVSGYQAAYASSGHLLFMRGDSLWAVPFDLATLQAVGESRPAIENVLALQFSVSERGHLAYVAGRDNWKTVPAWLDRDGAIDPLPFEPQQYGTFDLSPIDNRSIAIQVNGIRTQVVLYETNTGREIEALTKVGNSSYPVWSPDESQVAFTWQQQSSHAIVNKGVSTGMPPKEIVGFGNDSYAAPYSYSPDGEQVAYTHASGGGNSMDIRIAPVAVVDGSEDREFLCTEFHEWSPAFSPDGNWIAYTSDHEGQYRIYVRSTDATNQRSWPISGGLGEEPVWSPTGGELFYRSGNRIMVVGYSTDNGFERTSGPDLVYEGRFENVYGVSYDVSADGKRLLILKPKFDDTSIHEIRVVTNWINELQEKVPASTSPGSN